MKCPIDDTTLQMTERQGIEIDYCPQCRGVWLDRGELDKIIDRSAAPGPGPGQPAAPAAPQTSYPAQPAYRGDDRRHDSDSDRHYKKRRKESFLGDLFDF